jgi:hypothetical protein
MQIFLWGPVQNEVVSAGPQVAYSAHLNQLLRYRAFCARADTLPAF